MILWIPFCLFPGVPLYPSKAHSAMVLQMFKDGQLDAEATMKLLAANAERNPGEPAPGNPERVPKRARSPSPETVPSDDERLQESQDTTNVASNGTTSLESLPNICLLMGPGFSNQMCCSQLLV